jgi:hypothetical protein
VGGSGERAGAGGRWPGGTGVSCGGRMGGMAGPPTGLPGAADGPSAGLAGPAELRDWVSGASGTVMAA